MREGNWSVTVKMSMDGMKMDMPPITRRTVSLPRWRRTRRPPLPKGPDGQRLQDDRLQDGRVAGHIQDGVHEAVADDRHWPRLKFTGTDAYTGTMAMEAEGHKMSMALDAKRLGDCPK